MKLWLAMAALAAAVLLFILCLPEIVSMMFGRDEKP